MLPTRATAAGNCCDSWLIWPAIVCANNQPNPAKNAMIRITTATSDQPTHSPARRLSPSAARRRQMPNNTPAKMTRSTLIVSHRNNTASPARVMQASARGMPAVAWDRRGPGTGPHAFAVIDGKPGADTGGLGRAITAAARQSPRRREDG